jgi:hypothetical protein
MQSVSGADDDDDDGFAATSYEHPPPVRSAVKVKRAASKHRMVALLSSSADHPSIAYGLETAPMQELLKSALSLGGQAPHTPKVTRNWTLWALLLVQMRVVTGAVDWPSESVFAQDLFNANISLGLNTNVFVVLDVHAVARLRQPIEITCRMPSPSITQACFDAFVRDQIDDAVFIVNDDELRLPAVESAFQVSFACDPVIARWDAHADIAMAMAIGSWPTDVRHYSSATSDKRHSPLVHLSRMMFGRYGPVVGPWGPKLGSITVPWGPKLGPARARDGPKLGPIIGHGGPKFGPIMGPRWPQALGHHGPIMGPWGPSLGPS